MINIKHLIPVAVLALAAPLASTQGAAANVVPPLPCTPKHVDMLTYRGGAVAGDADVYLVFWGSWWKTNTTQAPRAIGELKRLFTDLGRSAWAHTVTQYCGYDSTGYGYHPTMAWDMTNNGYDIAFDRSNPPANPSNQDFTNEVAKVVPWNQDGDGPVPMIFTPPGVVPAYNLANGGCAYHYWGSEPGSPFTNYYAWAVVPYELVSSADCQPDQPNKTVTIGTSGTLSMIAGHEWAEAVLNPFPGGNVDILVKTAWMAQVLNPQGKKVLTEIGDLCQPFEIDGTPQQDITGQVQVPYQVKLSTGTFWMQPLWSNEAGPASQQGRCVSPTGTLP